MSEEIKNNQENPKNEQNDVELPDPSPHYEGEPPSEDSRPSASVEEEIVQKKKLLEEPTNEASRPSSQPLPPISKSEERTWAMLAHLSVLLNLLTGFLGGVAAIIIYFAYKDRSRLVAYHAMQSFIFQAITWLGAGLLAGVLIGFGTALAILIIPLLCVIPGFLILLLIPASVIYGVVGAVQVNNGEDFRYWQVGDWVRDILEPEPLP